MVTSTCSKCGRMAYSSDSVQIEERLFHKRCFNCQTCSKPLTLANFGVFHGAVYCKHHLTMLHSNQGQKSLPLNRDRDLRSASVAFTASSAAAAASSGSKPGHRRTSVTSNAASGPAASMTSPALSSNLGGAVGGGGHLHSPSMALPSSSGAQSASAASAAAARMRSPSMVIRSRTNVCVICSKAAYPTESIKVDTLWYHKRCFKCEHCKCRLTMGGFAMINTNAYCKPHFKQLFQSSGGKYDRAFGSIWNNSSDPRARNNTVIRKSYVPPVESTYDGANGPPAPAANEKAKPKLKAVNATTPKTKLEPAKAATMTAPLVSSVSSPSLLSPSPSAAAANAKPKLTVHNASNTSPAATVTSKQTTKPAVKKTPVKAPPSPYETQSSANGVAKAPTAAAQATAKAALASPARDLPPAPTIKAPAEPSVKVAAKQPAAAAPVAAAAASSSPVTPKMNGAEDPAAAFFRALKSNNTKSVGVALATLQKSKKLVLLVTPASQLTTMTPVEYAYVTGKIPLARQLVGALKEHFDSN